MPSSNEIRQQFIDFFKEKHGHTFVPSSSVVPLDDPTLLFANAGMNQFKPIFLGTETRPYKRAVNSQKCIRAGGKHNDLDDVGKDTYHHTFFEMLGNWSFGDYFKREAIRWAWELLTKVWGLDKSRLHATVFEGDASQGLQPDDEAAQLWRSETDIDPTHIHKGNKKDNFWEMGETGPCGPCTEIHYDKTPDRSGIKLVNAGTADVIEIWNLVFIQFNRNADRSLTPLPAQHVDTGMGFERVTAVLQGKNSNYDTDIFTPLMDEIGKLTGKTYSGRLDDMVDIGFRVIADHARMATFAITDGARPGSKKRDAVLRSVIRRAVRFGAMYFKQNNPFLYKLVPVIVEQMGSAFPELREAPGKVGEIIRLEEADFYKTLGRGMTYFAHAMERGLHDGTARRQISGEDMFNLHTTYGFPPDMTRQMAAEYTMTVDEEDYQRRMKEHETISRPTTTTQQVALNISGGLPPTDDSAKWDSLETTGTILGWIAGNQFFSSGEIPATEPVGVLMDKTCFYTEAGGQVGDRGVIATPTGAFEVHKTTKLGDTVVHMGQRVAGLVDVAQTATIRVNPEREFTRKNHTATHLLNWALRKVLGDHIDQKGSLVDPDKTRFDFSHNGPLSPAEVAEVERLVNEKLYADLPVKAVVMPLAEAKKIPGVRAVFGEKYPDPVRVLLIGADSPHDASSENSVEFCGGTHLQHTGQAGFFKIVSQEAVGKGVRRVTAVTGRQAVATVQHMGSLLDELAGRFSCKPEELASRIDALQEEVKKLQQQLKKGAAGDVQGVADKLLASAEDVKGAKIIIGELPAAPVEQMRAQVDRLRQKVGSSVIFFGWTEDGKVQLLAGVSKDLEKRVSAGNLIKETAAVVGGKGGGRPDMAQAGGKDPAKLGEALQLAKKLAIEALGR